MTYKEKNYQEAFDLCKKSADKNNAEAQVLLGLMYYNGEGVERDRFESYRLYKKAAKQGYVLAQYNLGSMYLNGQGVRQDKALAKEYFGQACDNKYQKGCDMYKQLN